MIPPVALQSLAEKLHGECRAEAVIIAVLHDDRNAEVVVGADPSFCRSLPQIFRKFAEGADDLAEDRTAAQPAGANQPGDIFRVRPEGGRWAGLLVTATDCHPWGIESFAAVPQANGKCNRFYRQFRWEELHFIGRPSKKVSGLESGVLSQPSATPAEDRETQDSRHED